MRAAAQALLKYDYAIVRLPTLAQVANDKIYETGASFFELEPRAKQTAASPDFQEGYREFGAELDGRTGRPDLSESFKVWFRNASRREVTRWADSCDLHRCMSDGLVPYVQIAERLLSHLQHRLVQTTSKVDLRWETYLQINHSRPASEQRDTITDAHEDGHLLTIVKPSHPGLMINPGKLVDVPNRQNPAGRFEPTGEFEPVELAADEAILFGSGPTYFLTGGRVKPLFHYVKTSGVACRQSIILFVNPRRQGAIAPWLQVPGIPDVDVQAAIDAVNYAHLNRHDWRDLSLA